MTEVLDPGGNPYSSVTAVDLVQEWMPKLAYHAGVASGIGGRMAALAVLADGVLVQHDSDDDPVNLELREADVMAIMLDVQHAALQIAEFCKTTLEEGLVYAR